MSQFPSDTIIEEAQRVRRELHTRPELSGEETATAASIASHLTRLNPETIVEGLGGTGVAAVFPGRQAGPTVMVRCELDGLPIEEIGHHPHRSQTLGKGHLCGHDGHMAILLALGATLRQTPPTCGRVVLLFQPAEETGKGARAVLADPRFGELVVDFALSLHNLPGFPLHQVLLKPGHANCASRGMRIRFAGKTAHASMPETGLSPALALASTIEGLDGLSRPGALDENFLLATVVHATLGERAFGVAPGQAEVWATLRTVTDERMAELVADAEAITRDAAQAHDLGCAFDYDDIFDACSNDAGLIEHYRAAAIQCGLRVEDLPEPMRFSEDFGAFGAQARSAMFFLGAGTDHPALHNPDYDFPDELIGSGAAVFRATIDRLLGENSDRR